MYTKYTTNYHACSSDAIYSHIMLWDIKGKENMTDCKSDLVFV